MKKILIIVLYFGDFQWYFDFFVNSCIKNQDVNFLFLTNKSINYKSKNLICEKFDLNDFNKLASKKLKMNINITTGYKVCDFRPAFGVIFEDYFKDYDFWGYCDTDIILGKIRNFITEDILSNDFISVKTDYPSGFFALYRNSDKVNNLYKNSCDFSVVVNSPESCMFDECGGAYAEVMAGHNILSVSTRYDSLHHLLEKNKSNYNILFEFFSIEGVPGDIIYYNGELYYDEFEVLLYHLCDYKKNLFSIKKNWGKKPENYDYYFIENYFFYKNRLYKFFLKNYTQLKYNYFSFSKRLDKKINLKPKFNTYDKIVKYKYMNEILFFKKSGSDFYIFLNNQQYRVIKSFLKKGFFLIEDLNLYFFHEKNAIVLIFDHGNLKYYYK